MDITRIARFWDWLTRPSNIPEKYLSKPSHDPELELLMSAASAAFASRHQLDFSLASLRAIDTDLGEDTPIEMGAYLGDVIVRNAPNIQWARDAKGDPGIALGVWMADPFEQVEQVRSRKRSISLVDYSTEILTVASAPSVDEGAAEVGLRTRQLSPWEDLVENLERRRRRRQGRRP